MNNEHQWDGRESPARRLGILSVASLTAVVVLSAAAHALIQRELPWEGEALRAEGRAADSRSLSLAALAFKGAGPVGAGDGRVGALREAVLRCERQAQFLPPRSLAPGLFRGPLPPSAQTLRYADALRDDAVRAAKTLLTALESGTPPPDAEALVGKVVDADGAFCRATAGAVRGLEAESFQRFERFRSLELQLFGFVLVVVTLQGVFVIRPAVREIRLFMAGVKHAHAELTTYNARLERSNKELQDFASVASHDLQEPLRKVQAFSDRLRTKYRGTLDDQGRDYLDRVQNSAQRMQTLINDLLTYARVTTKAQPFAPTDLAEAARQVVSDLEVRIEQVNGRVELGDLPTLDADPTQVRQLMQNLLGNALKYHRPETPPLVKLYSRPAAGGRGPAGDGGLCEILVEDNGIGFDEAYTDRIFTIFQRLHGRTEYEGTGVGLAVCRKIAERHGGTITARSTPGRGSTFLVTLPVRQPGETTRDGLAS